ncbi:MAG: DUF4105 domain-containing protein [bacterium]
MKKLILKKIFKCLAVAVFILFSVFTLWQASKTVPTKADWKDTLKVLSTAEFHDNLVNVKNVRNFQYDAYSQPTVESYYDKTYDLNKLKKVWYITEPFNPGSPFAHTFLSFEFSDGGFLAITIEGRLTKSEAYSALNGTLRTFPLMYIAADERDAVYIRANILKAPVYVYPLKANQKDGRLLLVSLLNRMNDLSIHPAWYSTLSANCTSSIAKHVNQIWPGMLPAFDWQVIITGYADKMALDRGLLDTNLNIEQAREKFYVTDIARKVGYTDNYSALIRQ